MKIRNPRRRINSNFRCRGFTLVELLVALVVTAIISSAVLTLAYAITSGYEGAEQNARTNAGIRSSNIFFCDAIKNCKLILQVSSDRACFWLEDTNGDGAINSAELRFFYYHGDSKELRMLSFSGESATEDKIELFQFGSNNFMEFLIMKYNDHEAILIENCTWVKFTFDVAAPQTEMVNLAFNVSSNNGEKRFDFTACKRVSPLASLGSDLKLKVSDDD